MKLKYLIDDILIYQDTDLNYFYAPFIKSFILETSILKEDIKGSVSELSNDIKNTISVLDSIDSIPHITVGARSFDSDIKPILYDEKADIYFFFGADIRQKQPNFITNPYN